MNKEITYLKNGTVEIVDESGNVKRRVNEDNIEEILAKENKVEHSEKIINEILSELEECNHFDSNCNKLLKVLPIFIALHIVITLLLGSPITASFLGSIVFGVIGSGVIQVAKGFGRKSKKGLKAKLDFAGKLKQVYKNELDESIIKTSSLKFDKRVENEVVPIMHSEGLEKRVINKMNSVYTEAYNNEKLLVRTRKK